MVVLFDVTHAKWTKEFQFVGNGLNLNILDVSCSERDFSFIVQNQEWPR